MVMGEYERALEYYNKDLGITIQVHGPDHPVVAKTYNKYDLFFCLVFFS